MRARELKSAGIDASTISRAVKAGKVVRSGRGIYQLPGTEPELDSTLAEASIRVPNGVICLISALAYHGLTDQIPRKVWMAIGSKSWEPKIDYPPLRVVRYRTPYFEHGVDHHEISGVKVPVYSVAKSLADAFRNRRLVDRSVAIECLRNATRQRKATPGEISAVARECGAWKQMQPYLEAIVSNG